MALLHNYLFIVELQNQNLSIVLPFLAGCGLCSLCHLLIQEVVVLSLRCNKCCLSFVYTVLLGMVDRTKVFF